VTLGHRARSKAPELPEHNCTGRASEHPRVHRRVNLRRSTNAAVRAEAGLPTNSLAFFAGDIAVMTRGSRKAGIDLDQAWTDALHG